MKYLIISVLHFVPLFIFSQEYLEGYTFRSQNQIDSFSILYPLCTYIGGMYISDSTNSIIDISPLKQIKKVKVLWIYNNPLLRKIEMLNGIEMDSIEDFNIDNNALLDTLILFNKSKICTNGFQIFNDRPLYMELFSELDSTYFFQIRLPNDGISELIGFEKARAFHIAFFAGSIKFPLFKNLKNASSLGISSSKDLSNMNNFSTLENVGTLTIGGISRSFSLQGLEKLKTLKTLRLSSIDSVYSFNTLQQVKNLSNLSINNVKGNINLGVLQYPGSLNQVTLTEINGDLNFGNIVLDSLNRIMVIDTELKDFNFSLKNIAKKFSKYTNSEPQHKYYKYRGNSLIIANNPNLDFCNSKAICDLVKAIPENEIAIENNGTNCSTIEEVKAACIVNTSDIDSDNIYVYPNPFNNDFHIHCDHCKDDYKINIYDILGRKVNSEYSLNNNNYYINTSEWNKGYYFLKLSDKNNDGEIVKPLIKF